MANSIARISKIGKEKDFKTKNMIIKIQIILDVLTLLKSSSLVFTKSFISGPSPARMAPLS